MPGVTFTEGMLVEGITLSYSGNGSAYTEVSELKEIEAHPKIKAPLVDITPLKTSDQVRRKRPGLMDGQEFSFRCFWNKTQHATFMGMIRSLYYWKVTYPDGSSTVFQGWVMDVGAAGVGNPDDPLVTEVSLNVNNLPVFTAGS